MLLLLLKKRFGDLFIREELMKVFIIRLFLAETFTGQQDYNMKGKLFSEGCEDQRIFRKYRPSRRSRFFGRWGERHLFVFYALVTFLQFFFVVGNC